MLRFFIFSTFAVTLVAQASQQDVNITQTRTEATQLALQRNHNLRAAQYSIERARAASADAGVLPNPEIGISGASDFLFGNEGKYTWSASLSQQFPVTGRLRMLRSLAAQEIELARAEIRKFELVLKRKVAEVFDQLEAAQLESSLLAEQRSLNGAFQELLTIKIERAEASELDMRQVRLTGAALQQRLRRLERQRLGHLDELRRLCGLDPEQTITINTQHVAWPTSLPSLGNEIIYQHPVYALKQRLATIASQRTDLAFAERWGDITVEVFFEESYEMDHPIGFERERFFGIGVSVPLPLNNRNRGAIASARVRERQLAAELEATAFELLNQAESLRRQYSQTQEQILSFETELIQLAETTLAELKNAYAAGQVDLTEVFRAQERLLELRLDLLTLQTERAGILTEWRFTTAQF
jgi:cobalt-zinc-cadmium efflux system outer membrane protein